MTVAGAVPVAVLHTGLANLGSLLEACRALGVSARSTGDPDAILASRAILLPGVGAFGPAMAELVRRGLDEALREAMVAGTPVLGICLGMQLLFEGSEEGGEDASAVGLGWFPGRAVRLGAPRVPHVGWNAVTPAAPSPLWGTEGAADALEGAPDAYFYFVHSYAVEPDDPALVCGVCDYGGHFAAAVGREAVWGVQFHPEKSGSEGLALLRRWLAWALDCASPFGRAVP